MRPWLTQDANSVISIVSVGKDKLLVAFSDNSLAVLAVPTLDVIDLLEGAWIGEQNGQITGMHVDEPGGNNFAYIGTSAGVIFVLELVPVIRLCQYSITWGDSGLTKSMAISDMQICPKVMVFVDLCNLCIYFICLFTNFFINIILDLFFPKCQIKI